MRRRVNLLRLFVATLSACTPVDDPATLVWAADVTTTGQVLHRVQSRPAGDVRKGTLAALSDAGAGTPLTYISSQRGDTVQLTFHRESGFGFGFLGTYRRDRDLIAGNLN